MTENLQRIIAQGSHFQAWPPVDHVLEDSVALVDVVGLLVGS